MRTNSVYTKTFLSLIANQSITSVLLMNVFIKFFIDPPQNNSNIFKLLLIRIILFLFEKFNAEKRNLSVKKSCNCSEFIQFRA